MPLQVPAARIVVKLDSLLRFFSAFFDDLTALKNFMERGNDDVHPSVGQFMHCDVNDNCCVMYM